MLNLDQGRIAFLNSNGIEDLIDLCKYCSLVDYSNCQNEEETNVYNTLISVSLGCLHNVTNENGI
jgi:hypothetical protein